eukprot:9475785-Pyramimonas_sp.AAC.1
MQIYVVQSAIVVQQATWRKVCGAVHVFQSPWCHARAADAPPSSTLLSRAPSPHASSAANKSRRPDFRNFN